jgi:hypothetical protein
MAVWRGGTATPASRLHGHCALILQEMLQEAVTWLKFAPV